MDPIYMSAQEAYSSVMTYRENNPMVPSMWRVLDQFIHQMSLEGTRTEFGMITFVHQGIELPSGRMLQYLGLTQTEDGSWAYGLGKKASFLWGGTLLENIIQALARDIVAAQMLKIEKRYRVVSSTHDECIYLAREEEADEALRYGIEVFSETPWWAPGLPLSAEGGHDVAYSK
jgi:DNA polymerase